MSRTADCRMTQRLQSWKNIGLGCLCVLLLTSVQSVRCRFHGLPMRQRNHGHGHRHQHGNLPQTSLQSILHLRNTDQPHGAGSGPNEKLPISYHLVLSHTKPTQPPWQLFESEEPLNAEHSSSDRMFRKLYRQRQKRSLPYESVCQGTGQWVALLNSKDVYGNPVEIVQGISVAGTQMNQYFYETYCNEQGVPCRGIDSNKYESRCQNKYIWTYGFVRFENDEEGWRQIQIRGSCNCAIRRKDQENSSRIELLDFVHR